MLPGTQSCGKCNKYFDEGNHMRCIINNGASFIFDKIDLTLIKKHTWSIARGHIRTVINGKTRYLHRLLLGAPSTVEIDHINQNNCCL